MKLLTAGGERAEVELVAAEVLALLRSGSEPGNVAVVYRDPSAYASVVGQVFDAYGIPFSLERRLPLRHTAVGRGVLALLRCALLDGSDADLLAYLRTPGKLHNQALADRLETRVRQDGAETAARARELWEEREWPLDEIDSLVAAAAVGPAKLIAELRFQLERLFSAPYRRQAHVLEGVEREDARAFEAAASALDELRDLLATGPAAALDARRLHDTLAELRVRLGERPQPDRVLVATPEQIRARRFEAVFVCGLQEGEFPRGRRPEPFLPDDDRRAIAKASGLVLPVREDELERERYLFYVCASRAERALFLSTRFSDEEGNPQPGSFFLEDAKDLFMEIEPRRRSLSHVVWDPGDAPTEVEWERAVAAIGPRVARRGARRPARFARARAPGRPGRLLGQRARDLRGLPGEVARGPAAVPRGARAGSRADGSRPLRARGAGAHAAAVARAHGRPARDAREPARGRADPARGAARAAVVVQALPEADARARGGAAARVRPAALPAPRGRARRAVRAGGARARLRHAGVVAAGARVRGRADQRAGRDRPGGHLGRPRARARLQERPLRLPGGRVGGQAPAAGRGLHDRRARAARAAAGGRRLRAAGGHRAAAARAPVARTSTSSSAPTSTTTTSATRPAWTSSSSRWGARSATWCSASRTGEVRPCPESCKWSGKGCEYPAICRHEQ